MFCSKSVVFTAKYVLKSSLVLVIWANLFKVIRLLVLLVTLLDLMGTFRNGGQHFVPICVALCRGQANGDAWLFDFVLHSKIKQLSVSMSLRFKSFRCWSSAQNVPTIAVASIFVTFIYGTKKHVPRYLVVACTTNEDPRMSILR